MVRDRSRQAELRHHGQHLLERQEREMRPAPAFLAWNHNNVFKTPARKVEDNRRHSQSD